jgi:hypothetical protein
MNTRKAFLIVTAAAGCGIGCLLAADQPLPWEREIPLREAAKSVALADKLNPTSPLPSGEYFGGAAMSINNLKMRTTLWGPPDRVTVSLNKNNVWDRRVPPRAFKAPTLQEVIDGANSPANKDYIGRARTEQRPKEYGYLRKEGGSYDAWREPIEYPFPCLKPVGQIIIGMDAFRGIQPSTASQSCANGLVTISETNGDAQATLQYVLGMNNDTYAIRGHFTSLSAPVWLRLYRHRDTSHLQYMAADGKTYTRRDVEAEREFNGPMDPPTSGQDGRYFWIRQKMPAEKTFPQGFEYVLMGVVSAPAKTQLEKVDEQTHLGTPPDDRAIAAASGSAVTATFTPGTDDTLEAFVTVVTTLDGPNIIAIAKKRLEQAAARGFEGALEANAKWWSAFYDRRENGRVFHGVAGTACSDDVQAIYRSYNDSHGGGTKTDMRQLECSASYAFPERDKQLWNSEPCYNEIFTTSHFVRNWPDSEDMWKQLVEYWTPGAQQNAREMFGLPGMFITHGYLPPIKPDQYVHTTITLEFCLGTMAQMIRPAWDEWDYGGDLNFLRIACYPMMKQMALFYAAYAKQGDDGFYHVIPSMEEERWGFYPQLSRNKDVISSLCLFRWALTRAAEAAELLGLDADLRPHWREVAAHMAPYATWQTPDGPEYAAIAGIEPIHLPGDHFGEAAMYPALLADEINLDSPQNQKQMMLRTIQALRTAGTTGSTLILLGQADTAGRPGRLPRFDAETLLNSRSGRVHLFPAVGKTNEVAFHNFQARGAFLVSACQKTDGVYFVEIGARRSLPCQIMNPWPGKHVVVHEIGRTEATPFELNTNNGECIVFPAIAGRNYRVEPKAL